MDKDTVNWSDSEKQQRVVPKITLKAFLASDSSPSSATNLSKEQYAQKKKETFEHNKKRMDKADASQTLEIHATTVASLSSQSPPFSTTLVSRERDVENEKKVFEVFDTPTRQADMAQSLGVSCTTLKKWLVAADSTLERCLLPPGKWMQVDQV